MTTTRTNPCPSAGNLPGRDAPTVVGQKHTGQKLMGDGLALIKHGSQRVLGFHVVGA